MKTSFLVASALVLAGCVSVKPVHLADGSQGHSISCNGAVQNISACLEKAGEICGSAGYTVVNQQGSAVPFAQSQGAIKADQASLTGAYASTSSSIVTRNLFVKCN